MCFLAICTEWDHFQKVPPLEIFSKSCNSRDFKHFCWLNWRNITKLSLQWLCVNKLSVVPVCFCRLFLLNVLLFSKSVSWIICFPVSFCVLPLSLTQSNEGRVLANKENRTVHRHLRGGWLFYILYCHYLNNFHTFRTRKTQTWIKSDLIKTLVLYIYMLFFWISMTLQVISNPLKWHRTDPLNIVNKSVHWQNTQCSSYLFFVFFCCDSTTVSPFKATSQNLATHYRTALTARQWTLPKHTRLLSTTSSSSSHSADLSGQVDWTSFITVCVWIEILVEGSRVLRSGWCPGGWIFSPGSHMVASDHIFRKSVS